MSTTIAISTVNILCHSNCIKIGLIDGGVDITPEKLVTPKGIPTIVVTKIPMSNAPVTPLTRSAAVNKMPKILNNTAGSCRLPNVMKVASDEVTIPAPFSPTKAIKSPIPGLMARRKIKGMALTICWRRPVIVSRMKIRPSIMTAVSANCHEYPMVRTTVKAKKAFSPMPGAKAKGSLA